MDVGELHVHVVFEQVPGIASELCDYLDNYPGLNGSAQGWEIDHNTDTCTIDIAMAKGEDDYKRAIDMVSNGVHLFRLFYNIDASVHSVYPRLC